MFRWLRTTSRVARRSNATGRRRLTVENLENRCLLDAGMGQIAPLNLVERVPFDGLVASFNGVDLQSIDGPQVLIDWGDGAVTQIIPTQRDVDLVEILSMHTYAEEGQYPIQVTLEAADGTDVCVAEGTAVVADAPFTTTGFPISETERSPFSGVVAAFGNTDPGSVVEDFAATIDWGDGTTSAGVISPADGGGFQVSGEHTYIADGPYAVVVSIESVVDDGAGVAETTATIAAIPPLFAVGTTLAGIEGVTFAGAVATFNDSVGDGLTTDYTATIDWGDGTQSDGTIIAGEEGGFVVLGEHTYDAQGSYNVTVALSDRLGSADVALTPTSVSASTIEGNGLPVEGRPNQALNNVAVATFHDTPENEAAGNYTATINWGDGSNPTPGTLVLVDGNFRVDGTHTYDMPGTYMIRVTVDDAGGSTVVLEAPSTIGSANERFVNQAYSDLLGRPADAPALAFWRQTLDAGFNRGQFVLILLATDEYRLKAIDSLYQEILGRAADQGGLNVFLGFLKSGGTLQQVRAILYSSDEFFLNNGGSNSSYVAALFMSGLGRPIDAAGQQAITNLLNSGLSRFTLATIVTTSAEAYGNLVRGFYQAFVRRAADQVGVNFYVNALTHGTPVEFVIADIVGSDEYYNRL